MVSKRSWTHGLVWWLVTSLPSAHAQQPGDLIACKKQGCNDCSLLVSSRKGFPDCIIYNSAQNLGGYEDPTAKNSYSVWWNSGPPEPGCKIIIRTPASTTEPACGLYLTGWSNPGCYFTTVQESFNVQFCCGIGDCAAAAPAASLEDAKSKMAEGLTSIVSISLDGQFKRSEESGNFTLSEGLSATWKRAPAANNKLANRHQRRACEYTETRRWSKLGRQERVSSSQNCNVASCAVQIQHTVTAGTTFSVGLSLSDPLGIVTASTGLEFHKEESRAVTHEFRQNGGTRGYVSFAPQFDCSTGQIRGCAGATDGEVEYCTPRVVDGQQSGDFSFVFEVPGGK